MQEHFPSLLNPLTPARLWRPSVLPVEYRNKRHRPAQRHLGPSPTSQDLSFFTCKMGIMLPPHQFSGVRVQRLDGHECEEQEAGIRAKLEMPLTETQPPSALCVARRG